MIVCRRVKTGKLTVVVERDRKILDIHCVVINVFVYDIRRIVVVVVVVAVVVAVVVIRSCRSRVVTRTRVRTIVRASTAMVGIVGVVEAPTPSMP